MFFDMDHHLENLNQKYEQKGFAFFTLYARPKIGKTSFLNTFSKEKKCLYYKAMPVQEKENFRLFKEAAVSCLGNTPELKKARRFLDLFRFLAKEAREERLLLILDDFPALFAGNRWLNNSFQSLIKNEWNNSNLFVIVCKPDYLYAKEASLETDIIRLRPFTFFEMRILYPDFTPEEQVLLYAVTGGTAGYLKYFKKEVPLHTSIEELFFHEDGALYRIPESYLQKYFREQAPYHTIGLAIRDQKRKLHEISDYTEQSTSAASSMLSTLCSHGIVKKLYPVTEDSNSRRTLYFIKDSVFRFFYTFAAPYRSLIEQGNGHDVFVQHVLPALHEYMKPVFEDICRQYLEHLRQIGSFPFACDGIGRWWGQHPTKKRTEMVPIAAVNDTDVLLGSCFWTDEWLDWNALYELQTHATLFPHEQKWYFLFAKSDFVGGLETLGGNTVRVFTLEQMCTTYDTLHM